MLWYLLLCSCDVSLRLTDFMTDRCTIARLNGWTNDWMNGKIVLLICHCCSYASMANSEVNWQKIGQSAVSWYTVSLSRPSPSLTWFQLCISFNSVSWSFSWFVSLLFLIRKVTLSMCYRWMHLASGKDVVMVAWVIFDSSKSKCCRIKDFPITITPHMPNVFRISSIPH